MTLWITGSFGNYDIGDDAMLTMYLQHLASLGVPRSSIRLIGHDRAYTSWYHNHPKALCYKSEKFDHTAHAKPGDRLLVTGGGTLNTRDQRGRSVHRMHQLVYGFKKFGIPMFISGQSVGPLGINKKHDKLAREVVHSADVFGTRDKTYSIQTLKQIKAKPRQLVTTLDDATHLPAAQDGPAYDISAKRVLMNVSVYTYTTTKQKKQMVDLCKKLLERGSNPLLLPHASTDTPLLQDLAAKVGLEQPINIVQWRGEDSKALCARSAGVFSARYHLCVFAWCVGVPCIGLATNDYGFRKLHGFAREIGRSNCVLDLRKPVDPIRSFEMAPNGTPKLPEIASFAAFDDWWRSICKK